MRSRRPVQSRRRRTRRKFATRRRTSCIIGPVGGPTIATQNPAPVILVVDDDPDILDALAEILEAESYSVRRARNGQEALERLEPAPQLILLDLMMPVMDGWEFARRLRERGPEATRVPILVLSADRNVGEKAREIGARGYLAKPFELSDLLDQVKKHASPLA